MHVGKSSGGWTFSFRGYRNAWDEPRISTYAEWRVFLADAVAKGHELRDEYGEAVTLEDFESLVESKRDARLNHTLYCREHHPDYARECWLDPDGHSFSSDEFS